MSDSARRTVTVMFTDVVASTEASVDAGQKSWEDIRAAHFAGIRTALSVHRGVEVKTMGDGFMAVFDGVSDALACAVTMQRATAARSRRRLQSPLSLRVGISAGEVSCVDGDYFGPPVVEASRLCAAASGGQIVAAEIVRMLQGKHGLHRLEPKGPAHIKGIPEPLSVCTLDWDAAEDYTLRVALADDSVLLREGVASVLEMGGMDVVLQGPDAETILAGIESTRPHVVVMDVRMPPSFTTEGLVAAERIRTEHPDIGVLVLSAALQAGAARRLLAGATQGIGYLLKDRVGNPDELVNAVRTVASGGSAIDPEIVTQLNRQTS